MSVLKVLHLFSFLSSTDSKSQCFKRHALNYLQEIGNGWFGKVRRSSSSFIHHIMDFLASSVLRSTVKLNTGNWSDQESCFKLVSFSWTAAHFIVHWSLPGDPCWSAVWLQLLSGRGEGAACQCQSSGAEEVLGRVRAIQVGEIALISKSYLSNKAIQNALHNT